MTIARVILNTPLPQLDRLLDYRIPDRMTGVVPGVRVRVPLRSAKRITQGFVVECVDDSPEVANLAEITELVSPVPVLRPEVWRLARAVADRSAGSVMDVLRHAIPARQVRVEKSFLAAQPFDAPTRVSPPEVSNYRSGSLGELFSGGRVALATQPGVVRVGQTWVGRWALTLAELAAGVVARGSSAILMTPDHRDLHQLVQALAELLPTELVVRWDSELSGAERYRGFLRALSAPVAIVGKRSAVYAPAERLGMIAVFNDGDPLLAEPLAPYVHARDAALIRQQQQGGALVFAGHTRTTEVQRLVEVGWLGELSPERPRRMRVLPTSQVSETEYQPHTRIPSVAWRQVSEALKTGPVLVQVARPGYSPALRCAECGTSARCLHCNGPLRQQGQGGVPSCLWCGVGARDWRCFECAATGLLRVGAGSVRTAEELGRAFPGVRVVVSDGERRVMRVGDFPALVVATRGAEPVADGGYRAVLLLDGERMVARETLRIAEDCLRWWADAAALAADGAPVVLVGVGGRLARALATGNSSDFARAELADRRELAFPPAVRVVTVSGLPDAVAKARAALPSAAKLVGERIEGGSARAIIRFDYAHGEEVAHILRAEIIHQASIRRKPRPGSGGNVRASLPLRVHFDDPEPFTE